MMGRVGGGWYSPWDKKEGFKGLGKVATVWDGEMGGVKGALRAAPQDSKVLILSDSQAAIAATKEAGRDTVGG